MTRSPSWSTGTVHVGETAAIAVRQPALSKRSMRSSNAIPAWRIASHGRSDQDERFLFPM